MIETLDAARARGTSFVHRPSLRQRNSNASSGHENKATEA